MEFLVSPWFIGLSAISLITNKRILASRQQPWFSDDVSDTPPWRIRTVEVRKKGFLQHLLNYGSLVLNRGELPSLVRVPKPHAVHTTLTSLIQGMQPALEKKLQQSPLSTVASLAAH